MPAVDEQRVSGRRTTILPAVALGVPALLAGLVVATVLGVPGLVGLPVLADRAGLGRAGRAGAVPAGAAAPGRRSRRVQLPGHHPHGDPVRWDPCRPVHVVIRPDGEPAGGREAVTAAMAEVGAAAGLVFVVDGETDEAPEEDRSAMDRARYGDRWSPVLVAWSDEVAYPPLVGAVGVAGPAHDDGGAGRGVDDRKTWVTGTVVLDAAWFDDSLHDTIGRRRAEAVLSHELAHLLGLGHSQDPFSLMSPTYQSVFDFSLSDRAGLARLGGGPCAGGS